MKRMKKNFTLLFTAFVLCLTLAVGVKADAAEMETKIGTVDDGGAETVVQPMTVTDFGLVSIPTTSSVSIGIVSDDGNAYRVGIFDVKGNLVATKDVYLYATFTELGLKSNKIYYYRIQSITEYGGTATSDWSSAKAFTTLKTSKIKAKVVKGKKAITVKVPKMSGVKNYTVYISTKSDSGFKKVKTVKPGKKVTITKFKKKAFKTGKTYYIRIKVKTSKKITCSNYFQTSCYVYKTYTYK